MAISRVGGVETRAVIKAVDEASPVLAKIQGKARGFVGNVASAFKLGGANIIAGFIQAGAMAVLDSVKNAVLYIGRQLRDSAKDAIEFQRALMEVRTLGAEGGQALADAADRLSQSFGTAPVEQVKAYYRAISAGANDGADALGLLEQANKLAKGGLADVGQSIDGLVSLMNAFGLETKDAGSVVDALFVAMKKGQTTVPELVESVGRLSGSAKAVGLTFDEMLAAVSAVTTQGIKTRTAVDFLNSAMVNVIKPTKEAKEEAARLGIEFSRRGIKAAGGFANFLQKIANNARLTDDSLGLLFGSSEAMRAMIALMNGDMAKFNEILVAMESKAGAADEANAEMSRGMQDLMKKAEGAGAVLSKTFGELFTNSESAKRGVEGVTGAFNELTRFLKSPEGKAAGEAFFKLLHRGAIVVVEATRSMVRGLQAVTGSDSLKSIANELYEIHKGLELNRQGFKSVHEELIQEVAKKNVEAVQEIIAINETLLNKTIQLDAFEQTALIRQRAALQNQIEQRREMTREYTGGMAQIIKAEQEYAKTVVEGSSKITAAEEKSGSVGGGDSDEEFKEFEKTMEWLREIRTANLEAQEAAMAARGAIADANRRLAEETAKGAAGATAKRAQEAEKIKRAAGEKTKQTLASIENFASSVSSTVVSGFRQMVEGALTFEQFVKNSMLNLLQTIGQVLVKMALVAAISGALGITTGGTGAAALTGGVGFLKLLGFNKGGMVPHLANGGYISGGRPGVDSVPAMLTPGEVVIPAPVVDSVRRGQSVGVDSNRGGDTYVTIQAPPIQTLVPPTSRTSAERLYETSLNPSLNDLEVSNRIRRGNPRYVRSRT